MSNPANYQKNMRALSKDNRFFADWLATNLPQLETDPVFTLHGLPNLRIRINGEWYALYHSDTSFEQIENEYKKKSFPPYGATFFLGTALGHELNITLKFMKRGHTVYVLEPNKILLNSMLSLYDFSQYIQQGNLRFLMPDKEVIRNFVTQNEARLILFTQTIKNKIVAGLFPEYEILFQYFQKQISPILSNSITLVKNGPKIMENNLLNLVSCIRGKQSGWLKNKLCGKPAVIVSTGPSLKKNFMLLKEIQNRAVIIAAAQALELLTANDISPSIITAADHGVGLYNYIKRLTCIKEIPLFFLSGVYPSIPREYQGNIFPFLEKKSSCFKEMLESDIVPIIGNVAEFSLFAAQFMGCDPIIFIGQDLSVEDTQYLPGQHSAAAGKQNVQRTLFKVKNSKGELVPTLSPYMAALKWLEDGVKRFPATYINATEGGAEIQGTISMKFKTAIEKFCRNPIDVEQIFRDCPDIAEEQIKGVVTILGEKIDQIKSIAHNTKRYLAEIKKHKDRLITGNLPKHRKKLVDISNHFNRTQQETDNDPFLIGWFYPLNLKTAREFETINAKQLKTSYEQDRAKLNLVIHYFTGLQEDSSGFITLLQMIYEQLKTYLSLKKAVSNNPRVKSNYLKLSEYLANKIGLLNSALPPLVAAHKIDPHDEDIVKRLIELSLQTENYDKTNQYIVGLKGINTELHTTFRKRLEEIFHQYIAKAKESLNNQDYTHAILFCQKASAIFPDGPYIQELYREGITLRDKINNLFSSSHKNQVNTSTTQYELLLQEGESLLKGNDYEKAYEAFNKADRVNPNDIRAVLGMQSALRKMKKLEELETVYQSAVERFPHMGLFYIELGKLCINKNMFSPKGVDLIKKGIKLNPQLLPVFVQTGDFFARQEEYQLAVDMYSNYLAVHSSQYEVYYKISLCYHKLNDRKMSLAFMQKALAIKPNLRLRHPFIAN